MTDNNIYTVALKYGTDNIKNGVTYNELLEHFKSNNIIFDPSFQRYFHIWFYENFFVDGVYQHIKDFNVNLGYLNENVLVQHDNKKATITGDAHQTYLDHQELRFAYQSAKDATRIATVAIYVTIAVGLAQILVSIFTSCDK